MALIKPEEYYNFIESLECNYFINGKKVEKLLSHPVSKSMVDATAKIYELALEPQYQEIMTAKSHLTGETINRNLHICRGIVTFTGRGPALRMASRADSVAITCPFMSEAPRA